MSDAKSKRKDSPMEYEQRLKDGTDLWIREASEFFQQSGTVYKTLRSLAQVLKEAKIPYAVIGALALGQQGFVRMTVDIDILLTKGGLQQFKSLFEGKGYTPAFPGAQKSFRSSETGIRVDVLVTGEFPGDGKPKAVSFPDPADVSFEANSIQFLKLENLIELKLASGISAAHRQRDLVDVQDLIRQAGLPLHLAEQLHESVRAAYQDLWQKAQIVDPLQK